MAKLTILHLSDLHLTGTADHAWNVPVKNVPPHDQPTLLKTLLADLQNGGIRADLIVVSGDLLDKGDEAGVEPVVKFLLALLDRLDLPRERLFIIPGNHDVLRKTEDRYASYDRIYEGVFGKRPFGAGVPPYERVEHRLLEDLGVEIVGFNSCEQAGDAEYDGYVGETQRARAAELLVGGKHFRIAVMHHHLVAPVGQTDRDLSVMRDSASVQDWLLNKRFHLVLHGHQHADWQNVTWREQWFQSVVGGASAGVGEYGREQWRLSLGFHVIDVDGARGTRARRHYFLQNRAWGKGSGGDESADLRFGVMDTGGAEANPARPRRERVPEDDRPPTRPTDPDLARRVDALMDEIRANLQRVSSFLRPPRPDEQINEYLVEILLVEREPDSVMRLAFGFPKQFEECRALAALLGSSTPGLMVHRSLVCQRVAHILWRWGFTLELIDDQWSRSAQNVVKNLAYLCKPHVLARAPNLKEVYRIVKEGQDAQPFAESAPDPKLYAVLRGLERPEATTADEFLKARDAALGYLYDVLLRQFAYPTLQDSSNMWWALRTGINHDDGGFAALLTQLAEKNPDVCVPAESETRNADLPEIYVPLRTEAYTLSNAQDIVEKSQCLFPDDLEFLHGVILSMVQRLVATPISPQMYLASVHYEALANFRDYVRQVKGAGA